MLMSVLEAAGLVVGALAGWVVLSVAVLDVLFWVDEPRESRKLVPSRMR